MLDLATLDEQLDENVAKPQPSRSPNAADDASVRQYYHERMEELDASVAAVGGVNSVVEQLRQEVERRQDDNRAAQIRGQFIRHGKTPRTSFGKDGIKKLKGRVDGLAATKPSADEGYAAVDHNDDGPPATAISFNTGEPQAQPEANVEDDETRTMVDGDAHLPSSTDPPGLEALALNAIKDGNRTMREHASRAGGRSLLDRQEGAYRVEFDDVIEDPSEPVAAERPRLQYPSSAGPANGPYYDQPSGNPSKRPISQVDDGDDDFDPTQDDGFEANLHSSGPAADRRRELAAIAARAASPPTHPPTHLANNDIPAPSHRPRKNPGSSIPPPIRPFDPDIDLDATNPTRLRIAHARVAARTHAVQATQRKPAQLRTPWSEDEEDALIMMIEDQCDEGISWSQLKAYDRIPGVQGDGDGGRNGDGAVTRGVLVRRSAEDMRFKARNLKVMFLQCVSLPPAPRAVPPPPSPPR